MGDDADQWYWDLERKTVVRAGDRGPASNVLGPYPSRAEAENWRRQIDDRNDAWQDADDAWNDDGSDDPDD